MVQKKTVEPFGGKLILPPNLSLDPLLNINKVTEITRWMQHYSRRNPPGQKLASFKRFSGIQRNFEIGFRCLVLLEKISLDKIFEAVTQKLAIRCK